MSAGNGRTPAGDAAFVAKLKDRLQRAPGLAVVLITIGARDDGSRAVHVVQYGAQQADLEHAAVGLRDHIVSV